jgi:hypothetical protein
MNARQLALDALRQLLSVTDCGFSVRYDTEKAIAALEADIAQAVEPVAWQWFGDTLWTDCAEDRYKLMEARGKKVRALYTTPPEPAVNADLLRVLKEASNALGGIKLDGLPNNATGRIVCAIAYVERAMEKATS